MRSVRLSDLLEYWPSHLWVTEDGRIWSEKGKGKWLNGAVTRGYRIVHVLRQDGTSTTTPVHRVVALAFVPNPDNKAFVNHIDGDKSNCHVDNLEWVTREENERHASELGLNPHKLSRTDVVKIKHMLKSTELSFSHIGKMFDVPPHTIIQINDGKTWAHISGFKHPIRKRRRGRRHSWLPDSKIARVKSLLAKNWSYRQIVDEVGVAKDTIKRIKDGEL